MSLILHSLNIYLLFPITVICRILLLVIFGTCIHRFLVQKKRQKNVTIVVLGDIGRSPRMSYHALSFAQNGFKVHLVGFPGSSPHQKITKSPNIRLHTMHQENISKHFPKLFSYILKTLMQTCVLFYTLLVKTPACEHVLVQNPPCIPALFCCWILSIWHGAWFVIDWHNYGYTILTLTLGNNHKLVKLAHSYERMLGHMSSANLCVTKAMQADLQHNWKINATVVYDCPPDTFKPLPITDQHTVLHRLSSQYDELKSETDSKATAFTELILQNEVSKVQSRPAFLISSTSWTEDEDFSILLEAFDNYNSLVEGTKKLPKIVCAITGKGPLKEHYLTIIKKRNWQNIKIFTPWLEANDYPLLISCADIGICLHTSSSGLDLPMKVVDMFGCEVPVAAIKFPSLHELVKDGVNGVVFENSEDLCNKLIDLLSGFPQNQTQLMKFKENLKLTKSSWADNWNEHVLPLFASHH